MKIDLKDVTFTIPFRYDSPERLRNINAVVDYLDHYFHTNISVLEESKEQKFVPSSKCTYEWIQTDNPLMHRTKCLNIMAKKSTTPFVVNYDTDVFLPIKQYVVATELLRQNQFDMIYPYQGKFTDIMEPFISKIIKENSVVGITENHGNCVHPNSVGGALFWNKTKFVECGMENEHFISWGWEDTARPLIASKLGLRICRLNGPLFHLNHPTSQNSSNTKHQAYFDNQAEYNKLAGMNKQQLIDYIKTWEWLK